MTKEDAYKIFIGEIADGNEKLEELAEKNVMMPIAFNSAWAMASANQKQIDNEKFCVVFNEELKQIQQELISINIGIEHRLHEIRKVMEEQPHYTCPPKHDKFKLYKKMEKILINGLNYKPDTDFFIRNLYNDKIVEIAEMVKREARAQGKECFAIRTTTPEIDTSDPLQAKVNIGFDTKLLESEKEGAMMYDNGWMVFSIDD